MKKVFIILVSLFALISASTGLKAQEVTILLRPGWNWIGYPYPESVDLENAFGDFQPMNDDVIQSFWGYSEYVEGSGWFGEIDELQPGWGYMYYSNRTEEINVVLNAPASQTMVTTGEPTSIAAESAVVGGTVTVPEGTHVFLRGVCWSTEPSPDIDGDHTSEETGIGSFNSTLEGLSPSTTYFVRAYAVSDHGLAYGNEVSFTTEAEGYHAYVDLGLPSGTLWATCNVGAETPEGYGDYFAWGEIQPKYTYNYKWSTYQYCNGSGSTLTKYCSNSSYGYNGFIDNLTTLLPEDDAATANWGANWRMPTKEEYEELYNNTTVTWTQQNGVNGRLFTASNGNSLFLPAAGYCGNSSLNGVGGSGLYWTSSLYTDNPDHAWSLTFNSGYCSMYYYDRYYGQSVRAVRSAEQNAYFIIDATANPTEGGVVIGSGTYEEGTLCELTATANEGYIFNNWSENGEVVSTEAAYSFIVSENRNLVANFIVFSGYTYVDLGLPSGLLWATCNVGADSPEDYGDYFAWGETQPKSIYNWSTYQYCNGSSNTLTKYCNNSSYGYNGFTDDLTTLLPEDDAATANWGSDWRMPTKEEWQELYNNTTHTWTTQNGVNGRLFTAANGSSLFLPAAGYRIGSSLIYAGSYGGFWSSSLRSDYPNDARRLYFGSGDCGVDFYDRYVGLSVRPVRSASQSTSFIINATVSPSEGGTVTGGGNYQEGQSCTVTATNNAGYIFINWTENDEVVSTNATYSFTVSCDRTLVANFEQAFPIGAINGKFTVNANGDQVYFSQGNLQYQASTNTWRFAAYQYDYVGSSNSNISSGWKDLFGWGTSGYNHGAVCYQPWSTSQFNGDYFAYGSYTYNLYDQTGQADWGYNPISNGGNQANQWRTLTQPEWTYIINTRTTNSGIRYAKAKVNNVNGVILLPDDWSSGTYSLSNTNSGGASYSSNTISASQWNILEQAGAVFLPAAGYRVGTSVRDVGSYGFYWSASYNVSSYGAYCENFRDSILFTSYDGSRYYGQSVRLVAPAEN